MNGKRVLVTGGSGVIGQELIQLLVEKGAVVQSIDKRPYPQDNVDTVGPIQLDLAEDDLDAITEFEPEVVFHLAAAFERTEESVSFWQDNWRDNTLGSHRLIDSLRGLDSLERVVFASSYLVYDPEVYLSPAKPTEPTLIDEGTIIDPRNLCGAAKYYTEEELSFLAKDSDVQTIFPRIFRVYGRGSKDVISRWVRAALHNDEIAVYNKENMFDFIHSRDVADGLVRLAQTDEASGPINLGRGTPRRVSDILSVLKEEIPGTTDNITNAGVEDLYETSCADISQLVELANWRPSYDLETGICDIIEYERARIDQ